MFNQILTAFQGFFSRSFWLGSFLPVAIVTAMHLAIAKIAFPGLVPLASWMEASLSNKASVSTLFVAAMIVVAYALTPFTPLLRAILDGRLLPDRLHDWLRNDRVAKWRAARKKMEASTQKRGDFRLMDSKEIPVIYAAAKTGNNFKCATEKELIDDAKEFIHKLETELSSGLLPEPAEFSDAADKLVAALEKNASKLPIVHRDKKNSKELAEARNLFMKLIQEAQAEADYRFARMASRNLWIDLLPTRVGDARRLAERYSEDTYQVDFDFIWTRIQLVLPEDDDGFTQRLRDAQSQVNSSALVLVLTITVPLVWLPILLVSATTPWLFLAIGFLSAMVLYILYEQVVQSQSVFGQVVRAAIDKYRLEVLTEIMRQPLPATLAAERILWKRLKQASEPGNAADLTYAHKKKQ